MEILAQIDPTATATWIVGLLTVIVMIGLAAAGSYLGSVRSVGKIETKMAENHGDAKADMVEIKTQVASMHDWVESIASGKSPHIAEINTKLAHHEKAIDSHEHRISTIEQHCASNHPVGLSGIHKRGQS